jgi:hypothetical protein
MFATVVRSRSLAFAAMTSVAPLCFTLVTLSCWGAIPTVLGDDSAATNSTRSGWNQSSRPIYGFMDRFKTGELTKIDMILLVSLGVVGMEAANLLSMYSGGTSRVNME